MYPPEKIIGGFFISSDKVKEDFFMKKNEESIGDYLILERDGKNYVHDCDTGEQFEIFSDKSASGREKPWRSKKIKAQTVSELYSDIADKRGIYWEKKSNRVSECSSYISGAYVRDNNTGKERVRVQHTNSCHVRLCPICAWRRSLKIFSHTMKIMQALQSTDKYAYIFLTLTVPNVTADNLSDKVTQMMTGWRKLMKYRVVDDVVVGWYRGLEITHNVNPASKSYDTYHPHFHCILVVKKGYFSGKGGYISHSDWLDMWRKAMCDNSITQVDVRRVRPKMGQASQDIISAVCEAAKYTVKDTDYILPNDWDMSLASVEVLDIVLAYRRLVAYGGVMKYWHKELNLDDEIDGSLVELSDASDDEVLREFVAIWSVGYQQYIIT